MNYIKNTCIKFEEMNYIGSIGKKHRYRKDGSFTESPTGYAEGSATEEGGPIASQALRAIGLCKPCSDSLETEQLARDVPAGTWRTDCLHQRDYSNITFPALLGAMRRWTRERRCLDAAPSRGVSGIMLASS